MTSPTVAGIRCSGGSTATTSARATEHGTGCCAMVHYTMVPPGSTGLEESFRNCGEWLSSVRSSMESLNKHPIVEKIHVKTGDILHPTE